MLIQTASLRFANLYYDVTPIGTYEYVDELTKQKRILPKYEVNDIIIASTRQTIRRKNDRDRGIIRAYFDTDLNPQGRNLEFLDKTALQQVYTLGTSERNRLKARMQSGLPAFKQLHWEREQHGPQSPKNSTSFG